MNISLYQDQQTAKTNYNCALQRAEYLAILGCKNVLELCVGPSLKTLEQAYSQFNIKVVGNDIDKRWANYYTAGKWIIGDAEKIDKSNFDAVVVAPPLSKGCSGQRKDSLSLEEITPNYYSFLSINANIIVYVLPGRTLSIKKDREQLYKFISQINLIDIIPLKNKIVKYVDVYAKGR